MRPALPLPSVSRANKYLPVSKRRRFYRIHAAFNHFFQKAPPRRPINPAEANNGRGMVAVQRRLLTGKYLLARDTEGRGRAGLIYQAVIILGINAGAADKEEPFQ